MLYRYGLLGVLPRAAFERFVRLIGHTVRVPTVVIHCVAGDDEQTIASVGPLPEASLTLPESFAVHVVGEGQLVVAPDTRRDPRFRAFGAVKRQEVLFYAGVPLTTPDGLHVGALSIMDTQPRFLSMYEEQLLHDYARLIIDELRTQATRYVTRRGEITLPAWGEHTSAARAERRSQGADDRVASDRVPAAQGMGAQGTGGPTVPRSRGRGLWKRRGPASIQAKAPERRETEIQPPDLQTLDPEASVAHLHRLAYYDPLTGLPNRVLFQNLLTAACEKARVQGTLVVVGIIDLDGFKQVNDTYGHAVGDDLLVFVSKRLSGVLRKDCTLARLSGDEFALLVIDVQQEGHLPAIAIRLVEALGQPFRVGGHDLKVNGSLGVAVFPVDTADQRSALIQADLAMYQAKRHNLGWSRYAEGLEPVEATGRES